MSGVNNKNDSSNTSDCSCTNLTLLAASTATYLSAKCDAEDLLLLGAFLTALADLILLNVEQRSRCERK